MRFFRAWYRRWRVHDVTIAEQAERAAFLHAEAQRRLCIAQRRERSTEARGDELARLVRRAIGGQK
jgi:hypothetical protein